MWKRTSSRSWEEMGSWRSGWALLAGAWAAVNDLDPWTAVLSSWALWAVAVRPWALALSMALRLSRGYE